MKNSTQRFFQRLISCIAWAFAVVIVLFVVLQVLSRYTPIHSLSETTAELERIRTELPLAEARWKAHDITDYEIEVDGVVHPAFCSDYDLENNTFSPWQLRIEQGQIIFSSDEQKRAVEDWPCAISNFLPPTVFSTIRQKLENTAPKAEYLQVEFDLEYGFVSDYSLTSNGRISDLNIHYTFSNFHPKKP